MVLNTGYWNSVIAIGVYRGTMICIQVYERKNRAILIYSGTSGDTSLVLWL